MLFLIHSTIIETTAIPVSLASGLLPGDTNVELGLSLSQRSVTAGYQRSGGTESYPAVCY